MRVILSSYKEERVIYSKIEDNGFNFERSKCEKKTWRCSFRRSISVAQCMIKTLGCFRAKPGNLNSSPFVCWTNPRHSLLLRFLLSPQYASESDITFLSFSFPLFASIFNPLSLFLFTQCRRTYRFKLTDHNAVKLSNLLRWSWSCIVLTHSENEVIGNCMELLSSVVLFSYLVLRVLILSWTLRLDEFDMKLVNYNSLCIFNSVFVCQRVLSNINRFYIEGFSPCSVVLYTILIWVLFVLYFPFKLFLMLLCTLNLSSPSFSCTRHLYLLVILRGQNPQYVSSSRQLFCFVLLRLLYVHSLHKATQRYVNKSSRRMVSLPTVLFYKLLSKIDLSRNCNSFKYQCLGWSFWSHAAGRIQIDSTKYYSE